MKTNVTIEGIGMGILFNNPIGMSEVNKSSKKVILSAEKAARRSAYWNADKTELVFPAWNLHQGLVYAASGLKNPQNRKTALAPYVAGDVEILPDSLGFGTDKYQIDSRRAVIQRNGIIRHRAWLPTWRLSFDVQWEESTLGKDKDIILEIVTICGERIGIGDYRPQKKGPFGKFRIIKG